MHSLRDMLFCSYNSKRKLVGRTKFRQHCMIAGFDSANDMETGKKSIWIKLFEHTIIQASDIS